MGKPSAFVCVIVLGIILIASGDTGSRCSPRWFDCGNGKCIAEMWVCDGDNDCGNFNDEIDCENKDPEKLCLPSQFQCKSMNKRCIPEKWHCDGKEDCIDGSDEIECKNKEPVNPCLSSQFHCKSDSHCIPEKWYCDGEKDCADGSDEIECNNSTEVCFGFVCRDHHCIPEKWRCDGNIDCADGSDEELCPQGKLCNDSEFLCSSGSCILQRLVCNGKKDCSDGSDEGSHCGDTCENATCSQNCKNTPTGPQCFCNEGYSLDVKDNKTCNDIDECQNEGFCSHDCTNAVGSYKCTCRDGYVLFNRTCRASGADPILIYSIGKEVNGIRLRSNNNSLIAIATERESPAAFAVDVDPSSQQVYWIGISNMSAVYTAKTDGSGLRSVISHGLIIPEDIAVDYITNNLYITDSGLRQVLACKADGSMCHVLHTNVEKPRSIALDLDSGLMYWSDWGQHSPGIYRSGMDGSRRISMVSNRIGFPNGIALDHTTNRLYWADAKLHTIEFITLDGTLRKVLLNKTVSHPYSLAVFEDTLYWSDWKTFSVESCNKFTGHKVTILPRQSHKRIMGVHVYHPVLTSKKLNPCLSNDCSHMCLMSPVKGFSCACPPGFVLSTDEKTCTKEYDECIFVSEGSSVFCIHPKMVGNESTTELPLSLGDATIARVAYDSKSHYMFVADVKKPAIYAINMSSLYKQELVGDNISYPEDISFDWKSNNLYWIDRFKGTAEVININLLRRVLILKGLKTPVALAISPAQGKMFIATIGSPDSVSMYDMDGKNRKVLHSVEGQPMSLALHPSKSVLYWADPIRETISYLNYSSTRASQTIKSELRGVMSVSASEEYIYWTSEKRELNLMKGNVIRVLPFPGTGKRVVSKVTYSPGVSAIGLSTCLIGNGGCSYVCLTSPSGQTCACSSEMILSTDNVTCVDTECDADDFRCANGRCLPPEKRCDGTKDCTDGSDEDGCMPATTCSKDQLTCLSGECVPMLWRCDGEPDCPDASDEMNCNTTVCNSESQLRCDHGQCVPIQWICDGTKDCFDGSDERNCNRECDADDFRCANGRCLPAEKRCDGTKDCTDGSDEDGCNAKGECKLNMFLCKDGACIYDFEVCDGHRDCKNNEDETNCTHIACQAEEYVCPEGRCILRRWLCDGDEDCADGSDEHNCVEARTHPPTLSPVPDCDGFYCYATGECLPWSKVCDGQEDCADFPDEGGLCWRSCADLTDGCSHICQKTPYGSKCFCNQGYSLLPDNKTCDDKNECLEPGICSQFCNNTRGSFKCSCGEGYVLHSDRRFCKAEGRSATLMYLLGDQIRGLDLGSRSQKVYINIEDADIRGMDYDVAEGVFYWTKTYDRSISSYSPSNRSQEVIVKISSRPFIVKYDWIAKNLYYLDESSSIGVCTKDGRICEILIQPSTAHIDSLAIAPTFGVMFWTVSADSHIPLSGLIQRADMDGSYIIPIVSDKLIAPSAITVDHILELIYWSDRKMNILECADFRGFNRRRIVQSGAFHPLAVAVFEDYVYWADWGTDSIMRCHKFIKENCENIMQNDVKAHILLVEHKVMQPKVHNKCLDVSCEHMCVLTSHDPVCICKGGLKGNKTCDLSSTKVAPVSPQTPSSLSTSTLSTRS